MIKILILNNNMKKIYNNNKLRIIIINYKIIKIIISLIIITHLQSIVKEIINLEVNHHFLIIIHHKKTDHFKEWLQLLLNSKLLMINLI